MGDWQDRFWCKVDKSGDCWVWTACRNKDGYGMLGVNRTTIGAHRLAWQLTHGEIPQGLEVLHACDNPACVRPDHLFLGTQADNNRDMCAKGRQVSVRGDHHWAKSHRPYGERNGHAKLTAEQVRYIRSTDVRARGAKTRLAEQLGVSCTAISDILHGRRWQITAQ